MGSSTAPPLLVQSTVAAVYATLTAKSLAGLAPTTQAPPAPPGRLVTFAGPPAPVLEAVDEQVLALAFSPTGNNLATAGGRGQLPGQVKIWDVASRQLIGKARKIRGTRSIAISLDGRTLACGEFGGALTLRDARSGEVRSTLRGHTIGVSSLAYSPDGTALLTAGLCGAGQRHPSLECRRGRAHHRLDRTSIRGLQRGLFGRRKSFGLRQRRWRGPTLGCQEL